MEIMQLGLKCLKKIFFSEIIESLLIFVSVKPKHWNWGNLNIFLYVTKTTLSKIMLSLEVKFFVFKSTKDH